MPLGPILSTLRRHKLTAGLLVLQVAFTCAIVCNVAYLVAGRVARVTVPSGVSESTLSVVEFNDLAAGDNPLATHQADLAVLRKLPGVISAANVSNLPLSGGEDSMGVCGSQAAIQSVMKARSIKVPGCTGPDIYDVGPDALRTLGLKLVAGQDFQAGDYIRGRGLFTGASVPAAIITQALARRLYPGGHAVGHELYIGPAGIKGQGTPIVGVVAHMLRGTMTHGVPPDESVLEPIEPNDAMVYFALRSKPDDRRRVLKEAVAALNRRFPSRRVQAGDAKTYTQIRAAYFQRDTSMIGMLAAAALGLLFVTALGIGGLASFWVGSRTRTIGIRRAIGATRHDIVRYFQTENFLIVTGGVVLGVILAMGLNLLLMQHYEVSHLPLWYLPPGAVLLWLLGQVSVLSPALRASRVPPVVATRSV